MNGDPEDLANERVIIIAAPNGARRNKADHPALPMTAHELADTASALHAAGVSVLHLHVRDEAGGHTLDVEKYREALAAIRARVGDGLILQVTTEAVGRYTTDQQMALVHELRPEAVSLALRELCPGAKDEQRFVEFCAWLDAESIWPQFILYSVEDVRRFEAFCARGLFGADAPFVLFVLGSYAEGIDGGPDDLDRLLAASDTDSYHWAVCCFGPAEHDVMRAALARGGHARIGFENNLRLADGSEAPDNTALVRQFTAVLGAQSRRPTTAAELRDRFRIGPATYL